MRIKGYAILVLSFFSLLAMSQSPILVKDYNPGPDNAFNESNFKAIVIGDIMLFPITDASLGEELGIIQNGELSSLKDIWPGNKSSKPTSFLVYQDKIIFTAFNEESKGALWQTDGTEVGTKLLFAPGLSETHRPEGLIVDKSGFLYFTYGTDLYRYDGQNFIKLAVEISFTTDFDTQGRNYCTYLDGVAFIRKKDLKIQLFIIENGLPLLRSQLSDISVFGSGYALAEVDEGLIFNYEYADTPKNGTYLWGSTDGSLNKLMTNGQEILFNRIIDFSPRRVLGLSFLHGIYSIDGTDEGAMFLTDKMPSLTHEDIWVHSKIEDELIFNTISNTTPQLEEFHITDGTSMGTRVIASSSEIEPGVIIVDDNEAFMVTGIKENSLPTFYRTRKTSQTALQFFQSETVSINSNSILPLGIINARLYFGYHQNDEIGRELYYLELDGPDLDQDGFTADLDCDDLDPNINPDAIEIPNNNIDENCDGELDYLDQDMDGFVSFEDCDDNNIDINPDAEEIPNNETDENCDGIILIIDKDGDGFNSDDDCDDNNPNINTDANEIPNNDIDENCDGTVLYIDEDGDGFNSNEDCNDNNPNINIAAEEIPNNDIDENCDGEILIIDLDGDGFNSSLDCDDNNANIYPEAPEITSNGIDEDCNGEDFDPFALSIDQYSVQIFPNPGNDILQIYTGINDNELILRVFSPNGKLLIDQLLQASNQIDITSWSAGIHIVEILNKISRKRGYVKFVKISN